MTDMRRLQCTGPFMYGILTSLLLSGVSLAQVSTVVCDSGNRARVLSAGHSLPKPL